MSNDIIACFSFHLLNSYLAGIIGPLYHPIVRRESRKMHGNPAKERLFISCFFQKWHLPQDRFQELCFFQRTNLLSNYIPHYHLPLKKQAPLLLERGNRDH